MKYLFLPYELAVIAKQKGFDEPCLAEWVNMELISHKSGHQSPFKNSFNNHVESNAKNVFSAPLHQQIIDWLKYKHNLFCEITLIKKGYLKSEIKNGDMESLYRNYNFSIEDYYDALNKSIEEAFKLI